jgi:hypothetical protein
MASTENSKDPALFICKSSVAFFCGAAAGGSSAISALAEL